MASAADHRNWAAQNEQCYRAIGGADCVHTDWALTILFYAAVHEVNAFLRERGRNVPRRHQAMKDELANNPDWSVLLSLYGVFQGKSNSARYKLWMPRTKDVQLAESMLDRVRREIDELDVADFGGAKR